MGTTADKLAYLEDTKAAIRDAIAARGVDVPTGTTFRDYAAKIGEISGGGTEDPFDPESYYRNLRPTEWLPLPEPGEDEMYFLMHVPRDGKGLIAFNVEFPGSCTVEYGSTESGTFVPDASVPLSSGVSYEAEIDAASCHSPTAEGVGQLVFRISGQGISSWSSATHSRAADHANWNVVDLACRLPSCSMVKVGNFDMKLAMSSLRYFAWFGENRLEDMTDMFCCCYSLQAIRALDTTYVTDMAGAFYECHSLAALPALNTSKVTNFMDTFGNCGALSRIPEMDTSSVESFKFTFYNCYSLGSLSWMDTSSGTDFESCFYGCTSLCELPPISLAAPPVEDGFVGAFERCIALQKLLFKDSSSGWVGSSINLTDAMLDHDALIELFDSLPSISRNKNVLLYNVPGALDLTEAEKQVLTAKGWTVVC